MPENHRCKVRLIGRGCTHELCVLISRGVPPELRCAEGADAGYGPGGGATCGCRVPERLADVVDRQLRDNFQESKRRGFVLVAAA